MNEETSKIIVSLTHIMTLVQIIEERVAQVDKDYITRVDWDFFESEMYLIRKELGRVVEILGKSVE